MPRTYQVAVIGRTGKGGYGHDLDTVWTAFDNVEVVAVADEDEKGRAAAAKRLRARRAYADYGEMLLKERPQVVSVAPRWLDCHRDMVLACAEVGANIFLEKPMCRTLAEADEMVAACERHHLKLAIAFQTRYSPTVARIRELIAAGRLGDIVEMRGRGKEDQRGGGEDLIVLGTHVMDLMRIFAGDARWCFARVTQNSRLVTRSDVREGNEGIGPLAGDHIVAVYGFDKNIAGTFGTQRAKHGVNMRFGLFIYGTKGVIQLGTRVLPTAYFLEDPSWSGGESKASSQPITSAGLNQPEPLKDGSALAGNILIVKDLMKAIEEDSQPLASMYDARASLEMILAVYESHRRNGAVELPLKNRRHPLTIW